MIDSAEFPMDHAQFCAWLRRHDSAVYGFDAREAIEADHLAALGTERGLEYLRQHPKREIILRCKNDRWHDSAPIRTMLFCAKCPMPEPGSISFPWWVKGPSPCTTRTFSVVLPKSPRHADSRHGALKFVLTLPNRPTVLAPRIGLPGLYTKLAEESAEDDGTG